MSKSIILQRLNCPYEFSTVGKGGSFFNAVVKNMVNFAISKNDLPIGGHDMTITSERECVKLIHMEGGWAVDGRKSGYYGYLSEIFRLVVI